MQCSAFHNTEKCIDILLRASCLMHAGNLDVATTCAVHIEDCEGWWLSGCCSSVAEHWRLKPKVSWIRLLAAAGVFFFLYFCLITSKFLYVNIFLKINQCLMLNLRTCRSIYYADKHMLVFNVNYTYKTTTKKNSLLATINQLHFQPLRLESQNETTNLNIANVQEFTFMYTLCKLAFQHF